MSSSYVGSSSSDYGSSSSGDSGAGSALTEAILQTGISAAGQAIALGSSAPSLAAPRSVTPPSTAVTPTTKGSSLTTILILIVVVVVGFIAFRKL
jgi:hypothetical protein